MLPVARLSWLAGALLAGEEGAAAALGPQIRAACESTGFFFITSTGVESQIAALLEVTKAYFDTPEEERVADCGVGGYQRGFVANGRDQQPGIPPDLKESFDMGVDLPLSHPAVAAGTPMHGPNQWPSRCPWLRGPTEEYFEVLRALGEKLLGAFACSVDAPEDFFEGMTDEAMVQMRMFRYELKCKWKLFPDFSVENAEMMEHFPSKIMISVGKMADYFAIRGRYFPLPEDSDAYGSFEHTDYGMFTLLSPDPIGGLEVKTRSGEWVAAPYIEGSLGEDCLL